MTRILFDALSGAAFEPYRFSAFDGDEFGSSSDGDYDGYLDEDSDAEEFEEDEYADGEYDENEYDDAEYEDEGDYPEDEYDDAEGEYEDAGEYDDGEEYEDGESYDENGEYDDYDENAEYDDAGEYEDGEEYGEEEEYGDEDQDYDEDLGYDPAVFERLNGEDDEYEEDEYSDEDAASYAEGAYAEDGQDQEAYPQDEFDESKGSFMDKVRGLTTKQKWIAGGIVGACLLTILIIILASGGGENDVTSQTTAVNPFQSASTLPSGTDFSFTDDILEPTQASDTGSDVQPSVSPTTHPGGTTGTETGTAAGGTLNASDIVWSTTANIYYHTIPDCGGMQGATSMTLEAALLRSKKACPECAGGLNTFADSTTPTKYYATTKGTWYHTDPNCQKMTGATEVTEAAALAAGKTACPVCIGYYGTLNGNWYHNVSNCQGMQNAITKTKAEWEALGKTACPTCLSGSNAPKTSGQPTETQVFCTGGGSYFHVKNDCSGMKGATQMGISKAVNAGKKACPRCISPSQVYVFSTEGGKYYHTKNNCSGMSGAKYTTAKTAISAGKTPCPKCNAKNLSSSSASTSGDGSATVAANTAAKTSAAALGGKVTADTATYVYATKGGTYYHTKSNCSGMKGATRVTYAQAVSAGKKACPNCVSASSVKVFATAGGKYYHTKSNCSGMSGAVEVTVSRALSAGKTACPTCAKALGSATSTKSSSAAADAKDGKATASPTVKPTDSTKASGNTLVYITVPSEKGSYYHKAAKCSAQNFSNGTNVTLEFALDRGYKPCPSCNPPSKVAT